jgi:hypothetical protein
MTYDGYEIDLEHGNDGEAAFGAWWAHLPDFIKPDYPFDLPPARLPFARFVFTEVGAPRRCAEAACRRTKECRGGDGPPCYRADRPFLSQILFLWWMSVFEDLSGAQYVAALRAKGSPYAPPQNTPAVTAAPAKRRAQRR